MFSHLPPSKTLLERETVKELLANIELLSDSVEQTDQAALTDSTRQFLRTVVDMFTSDDDWSDSEGSGTTGSSSHSSQSLESEEEVIDVDNLDLPVLPHLFEVNTEQLATALFTMIFKPLTDFPYFTGGKSSVFKHGLSSLTKSFRPDRPAYHFTMGGLDFQTCNDGAITFRREWAPDETTHPSKRGLHIAFRSRGRITRRHKPPTYGLQNQDNPALVPSPSFPSKLSIIVFFVSSKRKGVGFVNDETCDLNGAKDSDAFEEDERARAPWKRLLTVARIRQKDEKQWQQGCHVSWTGVSGDKPRRDDNWRLSLG
ncbi:hypothetical protein C8J56DRAFT_884176 [Mycena floridula]|nr:hypothetical protein C8J56DRAFT_884176 [Mycena floridula]